MRFLDKVDPAEIGYWLNIAVAVFFVWRASESDDRGAMFLLFAAAFVIIHAHGFRIHEAVKDKNNS